MHNQPKKIQSSKTSKLFIKIFNGNGTFDDVGKSETKENSIFSNFLRWEKFRKENTSFKSQFSLLYHKLLITIQF